MVSLSDYSRKVMQNFLKPKGFGEIKNPDAIGKVGNPICGDIMEMYLKIDKKSQKIKKIKFKTFGCAAAIASTSMLTQIAKGKTLKEAEKLTMNDVKNALKGLPQIKVHCSIMAIQALNKAIKDYREQNKK
ncbi:MAG: iron-sulfur cluster assembly scaffold protein [Candidatus Pacearchaeota archaeon]|jgi:nitrogen fixation NifU-like protein